MMALVGCGGVAAGNARGSNSDQTSVDATTGGDTTTGSGPAPSQGTAGSEPIPIGVGGTTGIAGSTGVEIGGSSNSVPSTDLVTVSDLTFAFGKFVAIGIRGNYGVYAGTVMTSADGETWEERVNLAQGRGISLAFGGERLVVLVRTDSSEGEALVSTDAVAWSHVALPGGEPWTMAFGNGMFLGGTETAYVRSTDGLSWQSQADAGVGRNRLVFAGGHFVDYGSDLTVRTSDGTGPWQSVQIAPDETSGAGANGVVIQRLEAGSQGFRAVTRRWCCFGEVPDSDMFASYSSADGLTWSSDEGGLPPSLSTLLEEPGRCLAEDARAGTLWFGADCAGVAQVAEDVAWTTGAFGNGRYVVAAKTGVLYSADGTTWTANSLLN